MSRTYRRKNDSPRWSNYDSKEEFDVNYELYHAGNPKPTITKAPTRPDFIWYDRHSEVYKKYEVEHKKWYRDNFCTQAYRDYQAAARFARYSLGQHSFKDYQKAHKARFHSDAGYGNSWMSSVPRAFVNQYCTRPLRRAHKREIHKGLRDYNEDCIVLSPLMRNAGWLYW